METPQYTFQPPSIRLARPMHSASNSTTTIFIVVIILLLILLITFTVWPSRRPSAPTPTPTPDCSKGSEKTQKLCQNFSDLCSSAFTNEQKNDCLNVVAECMPIFDTARGSSDIQNPKLAVKQCAAAVKQMGPKAVADLMRTAGNVCIPSSYKDYISDASVVGATKSFASLLPYSRQVAEKLPACSVKETMAGAPSTLDCTAWSSPDSQKACQQFSAWCSSADRGASPDMNCLNAITQCAPIVDNLITANVYRGDKSPFNGEQSKSAFYYKQAMQNLSSAQPCVSAIKKMDPQDVASFIQRGGACIPQGDSSPFNNKAKYDMLAALASAAESLTPFAVQVANQLPACPPARA